MATDKNFIVKNGLDVGGNVSANSRYTFDYNNHYLEAGTNSVAIKNGSGTSYLIADNTGVTVAGNLTVSGTQTILNTTTLDVEDLNITVNKGGTTSTGADGAGLTIEGPTNNASLIWDHTNQYLEFNKDVFTPAGFIIGTTGTKVGRMYNSSGVMALEAYTARQISFGNATNGELVRIDADGKVGIGVPTPAHTLDILRSTSGDATIQVKSTTAGDPTLLFDSAAANRNAVIRFLDQGSTVAGRIQYVHNGDRIDFQAGSGTGSSMAIKNGKVGVGPNVSPSHPFHVESSEAKTAFINRTSASNAANLGEFNTHYALSILNRNSGSYLNFGGNSNYSDIQATNMAGTPTSKQIVLNPYGGNVGIGMTSAINSKLSVFADGEAFRVDGTANTSRTIRFRNVGVNGSSNGIIVSDGTLQLKNEDANAAMYFNSVRDMEFQVTSGNSTAGKMRFYSYNTQMLHLDGANNYVGIGTGDNPAAQLHLKHASGPTLMMTRNTTNTSGNIGEIIFGNGDWDSSMASIRAIQDGTNDGGKLEFKTQSDATGGEVTRFTIFRTGLSTFNGPASTVNLGGGSTGSAALYVNSLSTHVGEMFQLLKNGQNRLTILNNGQATFSGKIIANTTDSQFYNRLFIKNGNDGLYMGQWDGANHRIEADANRPLTIQAYNSGGITLGISGNPKLVVTNAGAAVTGQLTTSSNVGIGTINPNSYSGQTTVTVNSTGVARVDLDISDAIQGTMLAESGYMGMFAQGANELRLGTSNTNRFIMNSIGNIRMGNVPPTALGPSTTTSGMHFQADHQRFTLGTHQNLTQQVFAVDGEMAATAGSSVTDAKASKGTAWAISSGQLFGPYTNIKQGTYRMSVRVRCNDAASAVNAMRMTVYTSSMTRVTQRFVSCKEFETADQYQTFSIDFDVLASMANTLELYVFPQNSKVLTVDYVTVTNHHESYSPKHRGIVTAPNQPDFLARRSGSGGSYSPYTYSQSIPYNAVVHDHGGNFDTSTGLFTAPVAGTYLFQGSIYSTAASSGGWNQAWLTINGARGNYTDIAGNGMDTPSIISTTHMVTLAIGDTVGYHPYGQNSTFGVYDNVHHTWFKGRLLG